MAKLKYQKSSKHILGRRNYKTQRHLSFPIKKFFFLGLTLFVFGGIFYFIFISKNFEIKDIDITGADTISKEKILSEVDKIFEQKKFNFLSFQNYFLFPSKKLQASLQEQFPRIGNLEIKKINPDGLEITIEERKLIGVWCGQGGCYYFDKEGIIFEEAPRTTGSLMLSIDDEREGVQNLGDVVLDNEQINFFQNVRNIVLSNFQFGTKKFIISQDGEFELMASENWRILLDKKESSEYQLSNLKYVLDEEIKTRRQELEYVDLRLGNRVYYKFGDL